MEQDATNDTNTEDQIEVPESFDETTDEQLAALEADLVAEFNERVDSGDTDVAAMTAMAEQIDRVRAEQSSRETAAAEAAAAVSALAAQVNASADDETQSGEQPAEGIAGDNGDDDDEDGEGDDPDAEDEDNIELSANTEVAANTSVRAFSRRARRAAPANRSDAAFVAASELAGIAPGSRMTPRGVSEAMHTRARSLNEGGKAPVASFALQNDVTITDGMTPDQIVAALDQSIEGQAEALVASGGWCAPSQPLYDVLNLSGTDRLLSLPSVGVTRGGVQVPEYIGFNAADAGVFVWTEDDDMKVSLAVTDLDIAGGTGTATTAAAHALDVGDKVTLTTTVAGASGEITIATVPSATTFTFTTTAADSVNGTGTITREKACMKLPCPSFTEYRLAALGVCLTHGNLSSQAFPELTDTYVRLAIEAHERRKTVRHLNFMTNSANADTVTVTKGSADAAGEYINGLILQACDYRSEHRIRDNVPIEAIVPAWNPDRLRVAMAARQGVDATAMPDARIMAIFASHGLRPQFVDEYQPLFSGSAAQVWPSTSDAIFYAAGAFFEGNGGMLNIGVERDSVQNKTNDHTLLFTESFVLSARRGPKARVATLQFA